MRTIHGSITSTAAAVGTLPISPATVTITLVISGLAAETIDVQGLMRGTTFTAKLRPIDLNTGALFASSDLGNGTFQFNDVNFEGIKFTKSGAVSTAVVTYRIREF
jgi:hypothetical protein